MRFSLREFQIITGLDCGPVPSEETVTEHKNTENPVWEQLFGAKKEAQTTDLYAAKLLKEELKLESDSEEKMLEWKKFYLGLILLVDSVLVRSNIYRTITKKICGNAWRWL